VKNDISAILKELCPPIVLDRLKRFKIKLQAHFSHQISNLIIGDPKGQDLDIYWNKDMAQVLETWGEGNVWNEIQFLMVNCQGKVLDIACGTGKTIELCSQFPDIDMYGCDISDFLIQKAYERGIPSERLSICDATKTDYGNNFFDYAYSIGSLEHFTEEGILNSISECYRIVRKNSFIMVPVSKRSKDEGWIKPAQSYFNNSVEWWMDKFKTKYNNVTVLNSSWHDDISVGKWFVCTKCENRENPARTIRKLKGST